MGKTGIKKFLDFFRNESIFFLLQVDLDYPETLHDAHNDYPLAPEQLRLSREMLSPTALNILNSMNMKPSSNNSKLVPNLLAKRNYIVHYRNLKLYLSLGLKLTKIHRVLKFSQRPWLKTYIDFNTQERTKATTSFKKDFFKLMNNAVFGKTMENLRKRVNIELVTDSRRATKLVATPEFFSFTEFSSNLFAVQRTRRTLTLNRPIQSGYSILELSKTLMYEFHYNVIRKKYGDRALLLFTDTDSLTYEVTTPNLEKDLRELSGYFDFSDYPPSHPLHSVANKKKIGFFKDELNGSHGLEFVGLRAKMYSLLSESGTKLAAKGINRAVAKKQLKHHIFRNCLETSQATSVTQRRIGSDLHKVYSIQQTKRALSAYDDKRWLCEDSISSYAYGHYRIKVSIILILKMTCFPYYFFLMMVFIFQESMDET